MDATERVAGGKLDFHPYPSLPAALRAIDSQNVYAALDVASQRPTLYVASAAGASVARVLERIATVDPGVRVRDTHPLSVHDPNGLNIFYLMLVTTIVGFLTVFQVRANAGQLRRRHQIAFVAGLAVTASLVLTLVDGPLLNRLTLPVPETWGILALNLLAAASFTSLMAVLIGRWAILPTFLFVVVLGNASSGGAVSPPLLPPAFAFFSQWLPAGATVTALRDAIYFTHHQHARPIVVLATWAILLFAAWLWVSRPREARVTQTVKEPLPQTVVASRPPGHERSAGRPNTAARSLTCRTHGGPGTKRARPVSEKRKPKLSWGDHWCRPTFARKHLPVLDHRVAPWYAPPGHQFGDEQVDCARRRDTRSPHRTQISQPGLVPGLTRFGGQWGF